jgi:biopolymer transport protein ExbD
VVVTVTPTQLLVQGRVVATLSEIEAQPGMVIEPLKLALKQQTDRFLRASAAADVASREITILGDKSVPYKVLKKVMASCTDSDYGKLSLAVLQREEAMNMASRP